MTNTFRHARFDVMKDDRGKGDKPVPGKRGNEYSFRGRLPAIPKAPEDMEYVYFIQATDQSNLIKIGKSVLPCNRLATIQSSSPSKLKLVGLLMGHIGLEAFFHELFTEYRHHYEWFEAGDRLVRLLKDAKTGKYRSIGIEEIKEIEKNYGPGG